MHCKFSIILLKLAALCCILSLNLVYGVEFSIYIDVYKTE